MVAKKAFIRQAEPIALLPIPPPEPETKEVRVAIVPHDKYVQTEDMKLWEVEDWQSATRFIVIADTSERAIALVIEESYDGEIVELVASEILVAFENEGIVAEEY